MKTAEELEGVKEVQEKGKDENLYFEIEQNGLATLVKMLVKLDEKSILFSASNKALRLFAMDANHVSLGLGYINADSFIHYKLEREHAFSVENADLKAILTLSGKNAKVSFSKKKEHIVMSSNDGFSQEFNVELEGKSVIVPGIQYTAGVLVDLKELAETISYADEVGSSQIKLIKDGKHLALQFKRGDTTLEKIIGVQGVENEIPDGTFGIYDPEILNNILKGMVKMCGSNAQVMVRMKPVENKMAYPLKVSFRTEIDSKRAIKGYILVAPINPS